MSQPSQKRTHIDPTLQKTEPQITLILKDGVQLKLSTAAARLSTTIQTCIGCERNNIDDTNVEGSDEEEEEEEASDSYLEINFPILDANVMTHIAEYLEYHVNTPVTTLPNPIPSADLSFFVADEFDCTFVMIQENELPQQWATRLSNIIHVADYLGIQSLVNLASASFATAFKGVTTAEAYNNFGLTETSISKELETKIREENPWIDTVL